MTKLGGDFAAAKAAAVVLLTQPGVPFMYYGEEVGFLGDKPDERIRTPMPWEPLLPGVGFTTGAPWQPVQDGADVANVATQSADPESLLSTYRELIQLRATHEALRGAETVVLETSTPHLLAILRHAGDETLLVLTNLGLKVEGASVDLSRTSCIGPGASATAVFGADDVAELSGDFSAYVPLPELAPYQSLIVRFED